MCQLIVLPNYSTVFVGLHASSPAGCATLCSRHSPHQPFPEDSGSPSERELGQKRDRREWVAETYTDMIDSGITPEVPISGGAHMSERGSRSKHSNTSEKI